MMPTRKGKTNHGEITNLEIKNATTKTDKTPQIVETDAILINMRICKTAAKPIATLLISPTSQTQSKITSQKENKKYAT